MADFIYYFADVLIIARIKVVGIFLLCFTVAHSQNNDSAFLVKPNQETFIYSTYKLEEHVNIIDTIEFDWLDSSTNENPNPIWHESSFVLDLGYWGSPSRDFSNQLYLPFGFTDGLDFFNLYDLPNPKYTFSTSPITKLNYHQGDNDLIALRLNHAQSIHPGFSFGINYQRLKHHNTYYANLKDIETRIPNHHQTQIWSHYQTAQNRYEIFGFVKFQNFRHVATGGITDEEIFANSKALANNQSAFLQDASNHLKDNSVMIKQVFRRGPLEYQYIEKDSTIDTLSIVVPKSMLWHKLEIKGKENTFKDLAVDSSYYALSQNMLEIYDRKNVMQHRNTMGWQNSWRGFLIDLWGGYNYIQSTFNEQQFKNFHNFFVGMNIEKDWKKNKLRSEVKKGITGYNKADYLSEIDFTQSGDKRTLNLYVKSQRISTPFFYNFQNGILRQWDLQSTPTSIHFVRARLASKRYTVITNFGSTSHGIYFDSLGFPQQKSTNAFLFQSHLNWEDMLLPWFGIRMRACYQLTNDKDIFRIPNFHTKTKVFLSFPLFKSNLMSNLGCDIMAWSDYKSSYFNHYTQQFQNSIHRNISSYTVFDPYFSGTIKNFGFYVKMIHLNEGWMGYNYYRTNRHPLQRRGIRLGISWQLNN